MIAAAGGAVFVAGTDAGTLVRVDPDTGEVSTVPVGTPGPSRRRTSGSGRWSTAAEHVVRIDPQTLEVATDVRTEPVTAIAADGDEGVRAARRLGHGGPHRRRRRDAPYARVATSVSGIVVAGGQLWATDGGVLTAYDLDSGESARPTSRSDG